MISLWNSFPKTHQGKLIRYRILRPGEVIEQGDLVTHNLNSGAYLQGVIELKNWVTPGQFLSDMVYMFIPTFSIGETVKGFKLVYVREEMDGEAYDTFTVDHNGERCIFQVLRDNEEINEYDLQSLISPDGGKFDHEHRIRAINHIRKGDEHGVLTGYHHPFYPVNGHTGLAGSHKGRIFIRLVAKQFSPPIDDLFA